MAGASALSGTGPILDSRDAAGWVSSAMVREGMNWGYDGMGGLGGGV